MIAAALAVACSRGEAPGGKPESAAAAISPLPRSVRVEQDHVVVEGHWFPVDGRPTAPAVPNAVRVVCNRAERSCKEELTRLAAGGSGEVSHETHEYRVEDWTKWGTPAGKLVATRREGAAQIEIRISLSGLTAEKALFDNKVETRWRIE